MCCFRYSAIKYSPASFMKLSYAAVGIVSIFGGGGRNGLVAADDARNRQAKYLHSGTHGEEKSEPQDTTVSMVSSNRDRELAQEDTMWRHRQIQLSNDSLRGSIKETAEKRESLHAYQENPKVFKVKAAFAPSIGSKNSKRFNALRKTKSHKAPEKTKSHKAPEKTKSFNAPEKTKSPKAPEKTKSFKAPEKTKSPKASEKTKSPKAPEKTRSSKSTKKIKIPKIPKKPKGLKASEKLKVTKTHSFTGKKGSPPVVAPIFIRPLEESTEPSIFSSVFPASLTTNFPSQWGSSSPSKSPTPIPPTTAEIQYEGLSEIEINDPEVTEIFVDATLGFFLAAWEDNDIVTISSASGKIVKTTPVGRSLSKKTVGNECNTDTDTAVSVEIQLDFDFVSMDPNITQESIITETFSASNSNDYISALQETGEDSFDCIASISEAVIIPPTPRPTQGPPTSSPVPSKEPTKDPSSLPSNTLSTKPSMQQSIIPTTFPPHQANYNIIIAV